LRESSDRFGHEAATARRELDELRAEVQRRDTEHARLIAQLGVVEGEQRRFEDRFVEVEQQNSGLAALYAASYQLHATVRRVEVLLAIQEIVINLLGSEELVVLGLSGEQLSPLVSVGVDGDRLASLRSDRGLIAEALAGGSPAFGDPDNEPNGLTACIPLTIHSRSLALIAIFRLLPQKPSLHTFDRELCELLATHAATALYCADLHEHREGGAC